MAEARPHLLPGEDVEDLHQRIYDPTGGADLLRIWVIYVDQGDGILIQLPDRFGQPGEPVEVLVDSGPYPSNSTSQQWLRRFVEQYYGDKKPFFEYAVITHHDQDHVQGLTEALKDNVFGIGRVYHNGLASYLPDAHGFADVSGWNEAVVKRSSGRTNGAVQRGMAYINDADDEKPLDADLYIEDLDDLSEARNDQTLQGVYHFLASSLLQGNNSQGPTSFDRAYLGSAFIEIDTPPGDEALPTPRFELVWPTDQLRKYGSSAKMWGETINGNSVTFKLVYGDFEMLFTGDHNDLSENALLEELSTSKDNTLSCDVLKVPHHGSSHNSEAFLTRGDGFPRSLVAVASMGNTGFKSKAMSRNAWQHPDEEVVEWLGGPGRVFHTFAHETEINWEQIVTKEQRNALIEQTHILIETDGRWFRVVEFDAMDPDVDLHDTPTVNSTPRLNGTRWITTTP